MLWLRWLARKFWLLAVTLVIALAILVQTGRMLSPQVERYRPQIAAWLSAQLGAPVEMDGISLRWQALEVALQLDGVRLGDQGQASMGYGLFHLDLLASLWHRELVWKNLQVDGFQAQLSRSAEGHWRIEGFPVAKDVAGTAASPVSLNDPARIFLLGPKVQVRNANITLSLAGGQQAQVTLPQILLENSGDFHRLSARAFIASPGEEPSLRANSETLRLILEGKGDPRDRENFSLSGYLQLSELLVAEDTVALIHQLTPLPDRYHWLGRKLARGSLWLDSDSEQGYQLRGHLNLAHVESAPESESTEVAAAENTEVPAAAGEQQGEALEPLQALAGDISGHWLPGGDWRLTLQDIYFHWRDLPMPPLNIQASGSPTEGVSLAVDRFDLGVWGQVVGRMDLLPGKAATWLSALQPTGELQNIRFRRDGAGVVGLSANLHNVQAQAHRGAPAVSALDGFLRVKGGNGEVQLDAGEGFAMHFPKLYQAPFTFSQGRGTVAWAVDRTANSVQVFSGPLDLDGHLGGLRGQFLLELPFVAHSRPAALTLSMGLRDAPVSVQSSLVPTTVSDQLREWLGRSLGTRNPGQVKAAGFVYRGYSYRDGKDPALLALGGNPHRQTVQLAIDLEQGRLDYAADWPLAEQLDARLLVSDRHVKVTAEHARLWNIDASDLLVTVTPDVSGVGTLLGVEAALAGPAADGLRLLRTSPLRKQLGSAFDDWTLTGDLDGSMALSMPLGGSPQTPHQRVDLNLANAHLQMAQAKLEFDHLGGRVLFDSETGLTGSRFVGKLWDKPLQAELQHLGQGELRDTQVVIRGESTAAAVGRWSERPELQWLHGAFNYQALVTIPAKAKDMPYAAVLELKSDLVGVQVTLPSPLGKATDEAENFVLRVPIGKDGALYHLDYGEHLSARFWKSGDTVERGAIALNAEPALPDERGIAVTGDLSSVDFDQWREKLEIYSTSAEGTDSGASSDQNPMPILLDLSTDRLVLGEFEIEHIDVNGRGLGAEWQLVFDSEVAAGTLDGVLNAETPMQLNLAHLRLPAAAANDEGENQDAAEAAEVDAETGADPLAGFDFSELPLVDFSAESVQLGDESLGRWSFRLRPSATRLVVSDIRGAFRGVAIEGRGTGEGRLGAQLMWIRGEDGEESSQFIGRLESTDLADVQRAWGQEPAIESRYASFDTALRWQGSPASMAAEKLAGEIEIDVRNGRFLRASDNAGSALLRLLSLFNFDTWARRLRLDFSDLYQSGMAFDNVRGEVVFEGDGNLLIAVPIQVEGPTSELQMAGRVNLKREDLNLTLVATLPVGNNLALIAAVAGGLPAAAGVYIISKAFKKQVNRVASVSYRIKGGWSEPEMRFDKLFDGQGAEREGNEAEQQGQLERNLAQGAGTLSP